MFDCQNFSELRKVRLATTEFSGYAITWYDQVLTHRTRTGERPIETWDELTELVRKRFVPAHYHRDLHQMLRRLLQGTKSVEDYYQEMEILMIKEDVDALGCNYGQIRFWPQPRHSRLNGASRVC